MEHIFEFQWRNELSRTLGRNKQGGNKLRTYYKFKKNFEYEPYLNLQTDFLKRRNITRFRISAHKLEIETGRYNNSKKNKTRVNKEKRLCKNCELKAIEDEEHVLMVCPKYKKCRTDLFGILAEAFPGFEQANAQHKFNFIMQVRDWEVTNILSKMLVYVIKERGYL